MLQLNHSAPQNVLAITAIGQVTNHDYKTVLIPAVEKRIKSGELVRLVYEIGDDFEGFSAMAALDDALLGLEHWREFEKIAVVTNRDWIVNTMRMFLPLFPAKAKLFGVDHLQDAFDWAAA